MKSLYGQYIKERWDRDIWESDWGFFTYSLEISNTLPIPKGLSSESEVSVLFVRDTFITKDKRGSKFIEIFNKGEEVARDNDCYYLACSIEKDAKDMIKLAALYHKIGFNYVPELQMDNFIYMVKVVDYGK